MSDFVATYQVIPVMEWHIWSGLTVYGEVQKRAYTIMIIKRWKKVISGCRTCSLYSSWISDQLEMASLVEWPSNQKQQILCILLGSGSLLPGRAVWERKREINMDWEVHRDGLRIWAEICVRKRWEAETGGNTASIGEVGDKRDWEVEGWGGSGGRETGQDQEVPLADRKGLSHPSINLTPGNQRGLWEGERERHRQRGWLNCIYFFRLQGFLVIADYGEIF